MRRDPQQTLMEAMTEAGDVVIAEAFVILAHSDGTTSWHSSTDSMYIKIGLVEQARIKLDQHQRNMEAVPYEKEMKPN